MADPAILGTMAIIGSAGSAITGAIGAGQSASASASAYKYKAGLALMNQRINKQNAAWAREAGDINAEISGVKSRQEIGATKVRQAASGLDVNTGTAAQVREDQGAVAKFDQDMIRYDASKTAYGYEAKAASDEAEAHMMEAAAKNAGKAGTLGIVSSILGGATSVASKWMQGQQLGVWGSSGGGGSNYDEMGNAI